VGLKIITQTQKSAASFAQCENEAMLFNCESVIHNDVHDQMVNKKYYLKVIKRLRDAVRR
jgi:hypothetical protein